MTRKKPLHPAMIRAKLIEAGRRPRELAKELGVSDASVCMVISGKSTSARIADEIAETIGIDKAELWPQNYDKEPVS